MGLLGDMWDGITDAVSSAIDVVKRVAPVVGKVIVDNAEKLLTIATMNMHPLAKIVTAVATILGVLMKDENVEEIGAKAMMSDKKAEDFESYNDYIEYLRNDVTLDKEKFDNATEAEKLARAAIGSTLAIKAINEKLDQDIPFEAWVALAKAGIEGKEAISIFKDFKGSISEFVDFVNGELTPKKEIEVGDKLAENLKAQNPHMSEQDIDKRIIEMSIQKD